MRLEIPLPAEDGRYQVLLSPMRENVCWYYEQGWPFLLVETSTANGAAQVDRVRVATRATLGRERAVRALGRAFAYPVSTVWRNRGLIRAMVRRDILGRYRGSFGGAFWTILNPLLLMLTYFFVFGVVLRDRYDPHATWSSFALYFLAGMLPWLAFSEAAGRAPGGDAGASQFRQEAGLRGGDAAGEPGGGGAGHGAVRDRAVLRFLLAVNHGCRPRWCGCRCCCAADPVHAGRELVPGGARRVRARPGPDHRLLLDALVLPDADLLSGEQAAAAAAGVLTKNPMYVLVRGYRAILQNQAPAFGSLWKLWLLSAVVFILGHAWFYKLRKSFPDLL